MREIYQPFPEQSFALENESHEREIDNLEAYLAWRQDFLLLVKTWKEEELTVRKDQDAVLSGLATNNYAALSPERMQFLQQTLTGSVSTQFLAFLTNPFYVGIMLMSFHSLQSGGDGVDVGSDVPFAEQLQRYQEDQLREREQHKKIQARLASA